VLGLTQQQREAASGVAPESNSSIESRIAEDVRASIVIDFASEEVIEELTYENAKMASSLMEDILDDAKNLSPTSPHISKPTNTSCDGSHIIHVTSRIAVK
jgi:hypothetical protein